MREKTLLILTPGFPSDENDTTCLPAQQLFVLTAKKIFPDIKIVVVTLQYPTGKSSYKWNELNVYALNGKKYKGLSRLLFWIKAYRALKKISNNRNLMGVLSFWCSETALIGNYFAKRRAIPHKIWISGQDARKSNRFVNWIKPRPDNLVAMSEFLRDEFFKNHRVNPSHVISNAVKATFQNLERDIDVIGAGSLIPLKQYQVFVEVIAEAKKTNPSIKAVLFGKGPDEDDLKASIEKLGLANTITLHGEVDHVILMRWMNRSKVLLHPSSYEGYSTVCLEALANGCHVVSFTSAENTPVAHWNIVRNQGEMASKVSNILKNESDFSPVLTRDIQTTVKSMISLFSAQGE
jgi:glycosyltransferase involved in cell wall biosynthesis